VNVCEQVGQATAGWYLLLASATWKSLQQPDTRMARPVLFSTTTRPGIDDPAVIAGDGSTTRADIAAEERPGAAGSAVCRFGAGGAGAPLGRRDEMWLPEHAATRSASTMTSDLTSI